MILESNILELLIERDALKSNDSNTKNESNDDKNDNNKNKEEEMNVLSIDESMIIFKDVKDSSVSTEKQYSPKMTTYKDSEILVLNEKLNTANYEIQVLQNELEISNLKSLSAQCSNFDNEENNNNLIISAHSNIVNEDDDEGENLSYNMNYLSQLDNESEILQNNDDDNKRKNKDIDIIDSKDIIVEYGNIDKYDSKHEQNKYFDYVLEHENEKKYEDEEVFITSNNSQFDVEKNITKEMNSFNTTESKNITDNHYSNGKLEHISMKSSQEEYLNNGYLISSSNNIIPIDIIEFNQNKFSNLQLEKSKDFFFSEKIISMSKKLKILKEKLIDRRYWKKVALCVAEAAVLACAGATAIPTLDVIEKNSLNHNNYTNNNSGNNDDEFSPFLADNRITRHLSSSRYKGSILVNEELLRTVLVMSQVRYAII